MGTGRTWWLLRFIPVGVLGTAWVPAAAAQEVQGIVVDEGGRTPVIGADVALILEPAGRIVRTTTDSLGHFVLQAPGPGRYGLEVDHPAYVTHETPSIVLDQGATLIVEVRLGVDAIPIEPLVVTARASGRMAEFERRRERGFGNFLDRGEIERHAGQRTSQLLRGMTGVRFVETDRGRGVLIRMNSGLGVCEPAMYVDGHRAQQVRRSTIDEFLTPDMLEAVEVYTSSSGVPSQFAADGCGVIAFWTRRGERGEGTPWRWKRTLMGAGAAALLLLLIR